MDRNRHIQELYTDVHIRWDCTNLTALTNAPLVDSTAICGFEWTAGNTKQVIYVDHNYHIQEMHVDPGGYWQIADLTELTSAPLVEGTLFSELRRVYSLITRRRVVPLILQLHL